MVVTIILGKFHQWEIFFLTSNLIPSIHTKHISYKLWFIFYLSIKAKMISYTKTKLGVQLKIIIPKFEIEIGISI